MNELNEMGPEDSDEAALRVAEITRLFVSIRQVLDQMIQAIGVPDGHTPKAVIAKLNELQSAHLKVLAAEEAFDDHQDHVAGGTEFDFEAIRAEIGSQLDRIRAAILADKVPVDADPCAACRAALSF